MDFKRCYVCGEIKPISEFALNKTKKDGHNSDCKSCRKIYRDKHYQEHKEYYKTKASEYKKKKMKEFENYKGTLKCEICGENRPWCLDFHHIDPKEKESEISNLIESPKKLEEELKKMYGFMCKLS
ncbi:MAG TPA: hypothetical protein DCR94_01910 [Firmicutes bacterium]|nr:hypothetical protein [Bacillota bacterium]